MIRAILEASLRRRGIVLALACLAAIYGSFSALHAKLDVFPDFVPPQVVIQTEAPGLAPEQVEQLVTLPVESALGGLGSMMSLRSQSIQGLSIVTVVFRDGTDILTDRQLASERLSVLEGQLPLGVKTPRMSPLTSSTMTLLKIGLLSTDLSAVELRSLADWTLRPRLLAVPGVAKVGIFGGEVRQLQIRIDPKRLLAHQLTVAEVVEAARQSTGVSGSGFVETPNQRIVLETEGQALTSDAIGQAVVTRRGGTSVRIADVAQVRVGAEARFGDALIQGHPGVVLTMDGQYGSNTLEVTRGVESALEEMKPLLDRKGVTLYPRLHRPATFIETALGNIRTSLLLGAGLVAAVLFLFLGHPRSAVISLAAIPLSLLAALTVLDAFGVTLNTLTLGGLAIAIGEVVDDAIIDVENILRRLRENRAREQPRRASQVVLEASLEVRGAVVYATFVVILIFVPILTLSGLAGKFFAPLGMSYLLAIVASLGVALTLTPGLSLSLFGNALAETAEPRLQRTLRAGYARGLEHLMRHPGAVLVSAGLIFLAALFALPFLEGEFLPAFREGHFVLLVAEAPGTSLPEMRRLGQSISRDLLAIPGVVTVSQQLGRAEQGEDPWGPNRSEFHVELEPGLGRRENEVETRIRSVLSGYPGIQSEVLTFLGDRIGESLTGETAPVVVDLFGNDLDRLDSLSRQVAEVLGSLRGAADIRVKSAAGSPREEIRLRRSRLERFGFRPAEVLSAVRTAYQGQVVAQTYSGNQVTDVAVILDPVARRDPEQIGSLPIDGAGGMRLPLRELAYLTPGSGRHAILHEGARRRQTVTARPVGRDVAGFVAEARREIARRVSLPEGVYLVYSGTAQATARAQRELLLHCAVAAVGIVLLLSVAFRSRRNVALILANVPFGLVGGVLAVLAIRSLSGQGGLNLGSLVGFVTLFGITMRNSIMLISHFEHLVTREGESWTLETAVRGASERVVPILMTALVTGLGLIPLALASGTTGREIEGPMATVILGGLTTSTLLNLGVLPTLALRFGHFGDRDGSPPGSEVDRRGSSS